MLQEYLSGIYKQQKEINTLSFNDGKFQQQLTKIAIFIRFKDRISCRMMKREGVAPKGSVCRDGRFSKVPRSHRRCFGEGAPIDGTSLAQLQNMRTRVSNSIVQSISTPFLGILQQDLKSLGTRKYQKAGRSKMVNPVLF